jgi:hypothetical protein
MLPVSALCLPAAGTHGLSVYFDAANYRCVSTQVVQVWLLQYSNRHLAEYNLDSMRVCIANSKACPFVS